MLATGNALDFVVVDGGEGGTGAAPLEYTDHVGAPLREALMLVHNTLVGADLRARVCNFHQNTLKAVRELLSTAGLTHTSEIGPEHIVRRISSTEVRTLATLYNWVKPGELLAAVPEQPAFRVFWNDARPDSFKAPDAALAVRSMKTR